MTAFELGPGYAVSVATAAARNPVAAWFDAAHTPLHPDAPRPPFFTLLRDVERARRAFEGPDA